MIDPKELRIGNTIIQNGIDYDAGGNKIWDMEGDEEIIVDASIISFVAKEPEGFNPIPLTEEWLLKFGFEKGMYFKRDPDYIYYKSPLFIRISKKNPNDIRVRGDLYKNLYNIKYVHQLQNLYFALTGQELTLK